MSKQRVSIPKAVSEAVLKEYRHKCAMCGRHTPQLHHIDQNPSNNNDQNLIPLCPNCHLQDIHDPTRPPDPAKLRLFRRYKDPLILDARFHPIFMRAQFLYDEALRSRQHRFKDFANELLDFVGELSMGAFYRKKILSHLNYVYSHYAVKLQDDGQPTDKKAVAASPELRTAAHQLCTESIEALIVELLRYQDWTAAPFAHNERFNEVAS